jgi:hypothetical protein
MAETLDPQSPHWDMFAHQLPDGSHADFGSRLFVKFHGENRPIVPVRLFEDPEGRYHGWLAEGEDTPSMIWPTAMQLGMCFPYGIEVEIEQGKGRPIRLRCEALEDSIEHGKE